MLQTPQCFPSAHIPGIVKLWESPGKAGGLPNDYYAGEDLTVELPFSGHGPLTEASAQFADYVMKQIGPWNPRFFCQANGWGPRGDWGAPSAEVEAAFDKIWAKPICRGQQAIQPADYDWSAMYQRLYDNQATYCEV